MKRSRRVLLKLMGTVTVGAVSTGFAPRTICGPGETAIPGPIGTPYCHTVSGGFGRTLHGYHGHAHAGG